MTRSLAILCSVLTLVLASCTSSGDPVIPDPSSVLFTTAGSSARVFAHPGSAQPGSIVQLTAGGTGSGNVAADGSFSFPAQFDGSGTAAVTYLKNGVGEISTGAVTDLEDSVTNPLFSTGAAPNDMLHVDGALYIANSLDNTVVRYSLAGTADTTHSFEQFAGPSYLAASGDGSGLADLLFVAANGDNTLTAIPFSPQPVPGPPLEVQLTDASAAFIGPGQPSCFGGSVFVPRAQILSFGPTIYGDGQLSVIPISGGPTITMPTTGRNASSSLVDPLRQRLYVTTAGELHFDADFNPSIETDSYLEIYDLSSGVDPLAQINLGPVGATSIALTEDGSMAYLGNLLNGNVYKVDTVGLTVQRGPANPIVLTSDFTYVSDVEMLPDSTYLVATSFNTDELFVVDTADDTVNPGPYPGPYDLSLDPNLLAGAAAVEIVPRTGGLSAFVMFAVANSVARVDLLPRETELD